MEFALEHSSEYVVPDASADAAVETKPTFQEVYRLHFDFVWRLVRGRGVPNEAAEDVVQEVFMVVHRRLDEFEGRSSLKTWLYSITRRVTRDFVRKRGNQHVGDEMKPNMAADQPGPDRHAERNQAAEVLGAILDSMDELKREAFVLAEMEGMSGAEIAEALGVNQNTVYSRLRAARTEFAAALSRHRAKHSWRRS